MMERGAGRKSIPHHPLNTRLTKAFAPLRKQGKMDLPHKYLLKGLLFTLQIIDFKSIRALRGSKPMKF